MYICLLLQSSLHTRHLVFLVEDIRQRPDRRDLELVDLTVALGVMLLDVLKIGRVFEGRVVLLVALASSSKTTTKNVFNAESPYPV